MSYFKQNADVHNQQIQVFKTPKKKDVMLAKAQNTPKTPKLLNSGTPTGKNQPKTPSTPKMPKSIMKLNQAKTPGHVRSKLKKELERKCREEDEYEDFSGDSSDEYNLSESEESENDSDEEVNSSASEDNNVPTVTAKRSVIRTTLNRNVRHSKNQQQDLVFESDKYFGQNNKKNATSNNTLDSLKTPRLQQEELFKLLAVKGISL